MGRCFKLSWYDIFSWLEYSVLMNKAYCFDCRYFSTATSKSENPFIHKGFNLNNWNHAMQKGRGLKGHDNSEDHNISMIKWENYRYIQDKKGIPILESLNPDRKSLVEYNREYLKLLLEYHKYLCSQEMAYTR